MQPHFLVAIPPIVAKDLYAEVQAALQVYQVSQ
jgi:hypothetical protein